MSGAAAAPFSRRLTFCVTIEQTQTMLSMLATLPGVHLLASIDHILAPLLWDSGRISRFQWLWHDITAYAEYSAEHKFVPPVFGGSGTDSHVSSSMQIKNILSSLPKKTRDILTLLCEWQLEQNTGGGGGSSTGLSTSEFRSMCEQSMTFDRPLQRYVLRI
jgi:origin recognition complex subunit 2